MNYNVTIVFIVIVTSAPLPLEFTHYIPVNIEISDIRTPNGWDPPMAHFRASNGKALEAYGL